MSKFFRFSMMGSSCKWIWEKNQIRLPTATDKFIGQYRNYRIIIKNSLIKCVLLKLDHGKIESEIEKKVESILTHKKEIISRSSEKVF